MNKVWIVECERLYEGCGEDFTEHDIEGVFDSEEKAVKYVYDELISDFDKMDFNHECTFDDVPTLEYIREHNSAMEYVLDNPEMEHKLYFYYEKEVQ